MHIKGDGTGPGYKVGGELEGSGKGEVTTISHHREPPQPLGQQGQREEVEWPSRRHSHPGGSRMVDEPGRNWGQGAGDRPFLGLSPTQQSVKKEYCRKRLFHISRLPVSSARQFHFQASSGEKCVCVHEESHTSRVSQTLLEITIQLETNLNVGAQEHG